MDRAEDVEEDRAGTTVAGVAARLLAYGLPLLLVLAAAFDLNVWPATGWRLFSGVRQGTQVTWIVEVTDVDGDVRRYDPASAGPQRTRWRHSLDRGIGDPDEQSELCEAWLEEAIAHSPDVVALTIHRGAVEVPRTADGRAPEVWRREVLSCS